MTMKFFYRWKWPIILVALCVLSYFISRWLHAYPLVGDHIAFRYSLAITFFILLLCVITILLLLRFWPSWYRRIASAIAIWVLGSESVRWVGVFYIAIDKEPPVWILNWFGSPSGSTILGAFLCIAVLACLDFLERRGTKLFQPSPIDEPNIKSQVDELRMSGARIEVIALIVCRKPGASVLLGKSPYHNMWMPPQEGVHLNEKFEDALFRCLQVECGLNLPTDRIEIERVMHLRSIRYIGTIDLPPQRHNERPIASDAVGTPFETIKMNKKAYWAATIILANKNDISPKVDGRELLDIKWYSFDDAESVIQKTNHHEKAKLLVGILKACLNDLSGAPISS